MLAITFALPNESRPLARTLRHRGSSTIPYALLGTLGDRECLLIHTGLGPERTRERLAAALDQAARQQTPVSSIIAAGYAGALNPRLQAESLFLAENMTTPRLLSATRAALAPFPLASGHLVTSSEILDTPAQKSALAGSTGADAVDMETSVIAQLCHERALPMVSLRVISDTAAQNLPIPFSLCIDLETERPRLGAILGHLAQHPWRVPAFLQFAKSLRRGAERMAEALEAVAEIMPPDAGYQH